MASVIMGVLPMTSQAFNLSSQLSFAPTVSLGASLFTPPLSLSTSSATSPQTPLFVYCGRGDKKTAKGKRFNRSFRNARPRNKKKGRGPPIPLTPPNKDPFDDDC